MHIQEHHHLCTENVAHAQVAPNAAVQIALGQVALHQNKQKNVSRLALGHIDHSHDA